MRPTAWQGGVATAIRQGRGPSGASLGALADTAAVDLGRAGASALADLVRDDTLGLGPLRRFVAMAGVTDVLVNGDGTLWIDRGRGIEDTGEVLDPDRARALATRLAARAGRRLDDAQPWVDGQLPHGVRLHAVLPPLAERGPCISLRLPRAQPAGVADLRALGAVDAEIGEVLLRLVRARLSFVVTGGTGSGKTTVLGALLAECDPSDRIVVAEDVRELAPRHPHVVRLQGRSANVEGAGAISLVDLVRQALRMRPDRLVVGEVRGAEVRELLAALNTGHEGGAGTVHANRPEDVPARFEALGALAGFDRAAVHAQLRGAVRAVVHCDRVGPVRRVESVSVVTGGGPSGGGEVVVLRAIDHDRDGRPRRGPGSAALEALLEERKG